MRRWRGALAGLALGCAAAWFWSGRFDSRVWLLGQEEGAELVLSLAELGRYTGAENSAGLYLAVLGQVFDVQRGRQHYGPGGAYSFFSGKDASRAFATGDFTPIGLVDDISGLSPSEMLAIQKWLAFYRKNYVPIGKVAGRFYDENGAATALLKQAQALIQEGQHLQAQEEEEKHHWPPCNAEWSARSGSRVLCSKQSGGISQEWTGVPRKLYEPGSSHSRCVCVRTEAPSSGPPQSRPDERGDLDNPNLQEYEGCHPQADWCALKDYSPA
ncbi:neuferricin isoform X1 [Hemicordylus capensis]|uniref:neuferricin isoform X1 n=1 Tax=Hemicordylus capensis TaxID=884348 RepID=UPI00230328FB|nr:neuferricin isoform X1 [Hemicordylus capensis]